MRGNLRVKNVRIVGVIPSFAFQRAKYFVLELHRSMPLRFPAPEIEGLLELEWCQRLTEWRRLHGSEFWRLRRPVAVFLDDKFIGSDVDLMKIASLGNVFVESVPGKDSPLMRRMYREDYLARLKGAQLVYCYFDICVDDNFVGTLVFQLYSDILPKTCENFTTLCLGTRGSLLSYKGSRIHRIVKDGWLQGGDIQYKSGGGGFSIYCSPLEDECYGISHDRRGVLSMANNGKHTNGSQFFITLNPTTWMDTYYVAFGQLVEGVGVLNLLENIDTFRECPLRKIEIKNCGKLDLGDVDDTDARYAPDVREAKPKKEPKKIETIADQVVRLVMEAVTECLAAKEHVPDITHVGDVPSSMNLDLYFQGFYSLPEEVLEDTAKYLRTFRRSILRQVKPSATEVVEVITYDLLSGLFTRLVNLDDVRETTSHPVYQKLVEGINMEVEMAEKVYVRNFVNQLADTAETMVRLISSRLNWMRKIQLRTRVFQEQLNEWVQSFTVQETFADDNFRIAKRAESPQGKPDQTVKTKKPDEPCCGEIRKKKVEEKKKKWLTPEQTVVDICCYGKDNDEEELKVSDFFSSCRYGLKRRGGDTSGKMSVLELIENGRHQLRVLRHQEHRRKPKSRICLEKRIDRWMQDVVYISETDWIRQTIFKREDVCVSHTEEIMYGAMTVGLLEIYYLMEQYLKKPRRKKYQTRVIYPEDALSGEGDTTGESSRRDDATADDKKPEKKGVRTKAGAVVETPRADATEAADETTAETEVKHRPCTCGDICCDCTSEPEGAVVDECDEDDDDGNEDGNMTTPPTPPPSMTSLVSAGEDRGEYETEPPSCIPSNAEIEVEELLADIMGEPADKIKVKSFKWMQDYILEEGCELKSEFAGQVHTWLESEVFRYRGFLSKHSLVTRASLLSFSYSLASLIKEENDLKSELKDFVFDLWELYFKEMMKEVSLEYSIEPSGSQDEAKDAEEAEICPEIEAEEDEDVGEPCSKAKYIKEDFDFDEFCRQNAEKEAQAAAKRAAAEEEAEPVKEAEAKEEEAKEADQPKPTVVEQPKPAPAEVPAKQPVVEVTLQGEDDIPVAPQKKEPPPPTKAEPETSEKEEKPVKKRKSPIVVRELVPSSVELRQVSPYEHPFWVKFLTEITKRALGLIAKFSRLPRRLYLSSDSQVSFDDKMKEWIEFNNFSGPTTGGKDIQDYIAQHHVSVENLDETARSFLRKKAVAGLMEKSSRSSSAQEVAEMLILDILVRVMEKAGDGEPEEKKVPEELWEDLAGWAASAGAEEPEPDDADTAEPGEAEMPADE